MKNLPHPETIQKWHKTIEITPGINVSSMQAIKAKVQSRKEKNPEKSVLLNLVMDEMKIKKAVELINGTEYGHITVGKGIDLDEVPAAGDVLVLMVVCENSKWKIPSSFYFCNALTGKEKAQIVKDNVIALEETGAVVTSLTFDGIASNFTMCRELGADLSVQANFKKAYFAHPTTKKKST